MEIWHSDGRRLLLASGDSRGESDVTEQESSVPLALLFEQSPDAMVFADREGVIRAWNAGATRIFRHDADTAVGQNLDLIVPERFREAHWRGYDRALADGKTKYAGKTLPTRSMRADGTQIYVELAFTMVEHEGTIVGALATARDITERFEHERSERARVRALEERIAATDGAPEATA